MSNYRQRELETSASSPSYEIEGPLRIGDPVHETLTLLTLKTAIEQVQATNPSDEKESILKGIDTASLPQWESKTQHNAKPSKAPASTQEFLRGVCWPDDPQCLLFSNNTTTKGHTSGLTWKSEFDAGKARKKKGEPHKPGDLTARSHFGDLQFFHAMATKRYESAEKTRGNILLWARFLIEVASGFIGHNTSIINIPGINTLFHGHASWTVSQLFAGGENRVVALDGGGRIARQRAIGALLHLIQDSYADGHTDRDKDGLIRQFHDYGSQSSHKHGKKDKMGSGKTLKQHIQNTPGAMKSIEAGAIIVARIDRMVLATDSSDDLKNHITGAMDYLADQVFVLSNDVSAAGPGEEFAAFSSITRKLPPNPGAWRNTHPEIRQAIARILQRLRESDASEIKIKGYTIESLFTLAILENRRVEDKQIVEMTQVELKPHDYYTKKGITEPDKKKEKVLLAPSPQEKQTVLDIVPGVRSKPVHKFTVALLSAATNIDPKQLSEDCPDLGLAGHPGIVIPVIKLPFLWLPLANRMKLSTALHDFTDYLRGANIEGLNKAVWGIEGREVSAVISAVLSVHY